MVPAASPHAIPTRTQPWRLLRWIAHQPAALAAIQNAISGVSVAPRWACPKSLGMRRIEAAAPSPATPPQAAAAQRKASAIIPANRRAGASRRPARSPITPRVAHHVSPIASLYTGGCGL